MGTGKYPYRLEQMKWSVLNLTTEGAIMSRNSCTRASPGWPGWSVFVFLNSVPPDFLHQKTSDASLI